MDEESGQPYYYDAESETTQWEFPQTVLEQALAMINWQRASQDDQVYYYSEDTGETSWDLPKGILVHVRSIMQNEEISLSEVTGGSEQTGDDVEMDAGTKDEAVNNDGEGGKADDNIASGDSVKEILKLDEVFDEDKQVDTPVSDDELFYSLLKDLNVDQTWTLNRFISVAIEDRRYFSIEEPALRRAKFEEYINEKTLEDFEKADKKLYQKKFVELCEKLGAEYYSQWETVGKAMKGNEVYGFIPEKYRKQFFNDYIADLRKQHETEAKETQTKELQEYLSKNVTVATKFKVIFNDLENQFPNLSKRYLLEQFEKAVESAYENFLEDYNNNADLNYTFDRKTRDSFKTLLETVDKSSQMRWADFLNQVKTKPEFIDLCGHHGSTPIEFFWDIIDQQNIQLRELKESVKEELSRQNVIIGDTSLEEFHDLAKDIVSSQTELDIIYEQLKKDTTHGQKRHKPINNKRY